MNETKEVLDNFYEYLFPCVSFVMEYKKKIDLFDLCKRHRRVRMNRSNTLFECRVP